MGEIADMILDGTLDEETGEYIGDINEQKYGTVLPGFPISYERERRQKTKCNVCGKYVKTIGLAQHAKAVHGT